MEPVLLGMAAPAAIGTAGNLVDRAMHRVAEPFATVMHAIAGTLSSDPSVAIESSGNISDKLQSLQAQLATEIEQTLVAAGVDLSEPIALRLGEADGQLEVVGEHPQKALIEAALADRRELPGSFAEVLALHQWLSSGGEGDGGEAIHIAEFGQRLHGTPTALLVVNDDGAALEFRTSATHASELATS